MASEPQTESLSFFISVKLVIFLFSLSSACIAGFYLHPFLLTIATESMPQLWSVLQGWLTAPFLFVLLNVVVGALYFSSRMMPRGKWQQPDGTTLSETDDGNPDLPDEKSYGKHLEVEESKSRFEGKPFTRLVRSKSEQIAQPTRRTEYTASRLKKAGTFESTSTVVKPVVVADPPEDEQHAAGGEGVDKKAEDFISRFYQKVKLQRLESLLRHQQSLQQGPA